MPVSASIRQIPLLRIVPPFVLGTITGIIFPKNQPVFIGLFLLCFLALLVFALRKKTAQNYALRWVFGVLTLFSMFFAGLVLAQQNKPSPKYQPPAESTRQTVSVVLLEFPSEKENSYKALARLEAVRDSSGAWHKASDKLLVYFEKDSTISNLKYGDWLVINGFINPVKNNGNPYEFDYKRFLARRGIHFQSYAQSGRWRKLDGGRGNPLFETASQLRKHLLSVYRKNGIQGDEFAIASALTLGYKDYLDKDIKAAYAGSGAMHILAVSGLHVGIIFMIFKFLLQWLDRLKYGKTIRSLIIIAALWFFALLTGLSPSVRRAALMFTFVQGAEISRRPGNVYNSLLFSAFVLILLNPYIVAEVGFQLSYLAVFSIVFLQPKFHRLLYIKNKIGDKIWGLFTVSLAAQIGTFPIGVFYFHQFPTYFWLTNLFVIPLTFCIVLAGVAVFATSFFQPLAEMLAWLMEWLLRILNLIVNLIQQLPHATLKNISFSLPELFLVYALIFALVLFFIYKKARFLQAALIFSAFWGLSFLINHTQAVRQQKFIVYNANDIPLYNVLSGKNNWVLTDSTGLKSLQNIEYAAGSFWLAQKAGKPRLAALEYLPDDSLVAAQSVAFYKNFLKIGSKRFFIVRNKEITHWASPKKFKVDGIILSNNVRVRIADLLKLFETRQIIIDSSNSWYQEKFWLSECQGLKIKCHAVTRHGAFILDLKP